MIGREWVTVFILRLDTTGRVNRPPHIAAGADVFQTVQAFLIKAGSKAPEISGVTFRPFL